MKRATIWLAAILAICFDCSAWAQMTFRGFVLNQDMFRTNESLDAMLIRNRLRLNTEISGENVSGFA
ncbi:MAG: hypothetical protein WC703_08650 [Candidatus Neomarinimicrobiota bacterium]